MSDSRVLGKSGATTSAENRGLTRRSFLAMTGAASAAVLIYRETTAAPPARADATLPDYSAIIGLL